MAVGRNHAYTSRGVPATLFVGSHLLPVEEVVNEQKGATTITYPDCNTPISIEP